MRYPIFTTVTANPGRIAINPLDVACVLPFGEQAIIHLNAPAGDGHLTWTVKENLEKVVASLEDATQGPAQPAPARAPR
jgi:hypothetical protein